MSIFLLTASLIGVTLLFLVWNFGMNIEECIRRGLKSIPKKKVYNLRSGFIPENKPTEYNFKGYRVCHNTSCYCTGKCVSAGELNKARAIVKEFGQ